MGPKALVIKHGEYGATIFFREGAFGIGRHPFRAPALPIEEVKDPTGAGDSFAGGFMGYIASQGDREPRSAEAGAVLRRRDGIVCGGAFRHRTSAIAHSRRDRRPLSDLPRIDPPRMSSSARAGRWDRKPRLWPGLRPAFPLFSFLFYFRHGDMLLYGDAVAHINIARRVFDSRTPGLLQLGTVWLPLAPSADDSVSAFRLDVADGHWWIDSFDGWRMFSERSESSVWCAERWTRLPNRARRRESPPGEPRLSMPQIRI